ncbi:YbjN domain-containing protein [Coleofasciculus sp. C1-SOL-03]|uniref:YbjN domain-containing protein n=1 Tax=Coleofasciculus sp. C1-SOL-03 TaxID=3069522 RepID=UPI0040634E0C
MMSVGWFLPKQFIFYHIMDNENNSSLWTTVSLSHYFLIPNNQELPNGNCIILTSSGNKKTVDLNALAPFEITEDAAKSHVQAEMSHSLKQAKNGLSNFIVMAAAQAAKENTFSTTHSQSGAKLVAALLDITPEEVRNNPESAKEELRQVLVTTFGEVIQGVTSKDSAKLEAARTRMHNLQVILQSQGFETSKILENFPEKLPDKLLNLVAKTTPHESTKSVANVLRNLAEKNLEKIPKNKTSPRSIFEAMVNFFQEDNWHYVQLQGRSVLRLAFEGKNGKYDCYAQAIEEQQQFIFYSIGSIKIPKSKRRAVGEFLSRANYGMIIGNFELNFDDGEIRYKTSTNVKNQSLDSDTIKQLVYTNVKMMDEYLPGIIAVKSGVSPADAIRDLP